MYSELVLEHFTNPRNAGTIQDADGIGLAGDAACGDVNKIFLKIKDKRIEEITFQTFGCGAAIAASSMVTEIVKGRTLEEARALTNTEHSVIMKRKTRSEIESDA